MKYTFYLVQKNINEVSKMFKNIIKVSHFPKRYQCIIIHENTSKKLGLITHHVIYLILRNKKHCLINDA